MSDGNGNEAVAIEAFLSVVPDVSRATAARVLLEADHNVNRAINFYLNNLETTFERGRVESDASDEAKVASTSLGIDRSSVTVAEVVPTKDKDEHQADGTKYVYSVEESSFFDSKGSRLWNDVLRNCEGAKYEDRDFPPSATSIDGRLVNEKLGSSHIICHCKVNARIRTVQKDGPNQGRLFYSCGQQRKCNFFMWTSRAPHTGQALKLQWQRFDSQEHVPVSRKGFAPSDVLQGAVGDCWFLSGLAVICERSDLIERIFPIRNKNIEGCYEVCLFLDGEWKQLLVDPFLPVNEKGKLAFAKSSQNTIWVPLVEKAYAKAHKSYSAISGGFVSEAMFDLTGLPQEVIELESTRFDSEVTWARLLSFSKADFPMGCATSFDFTLKSVGLVGCHAYSILEVVEINDAKPGVQLQIDEIFANKSTKKRKLERRQADDEVLRLLRIRNPWGRREFTGDWSDTSEKWTSKLHSKLGKTKKNDGTFWMSYTDFLCRFSIIEVCKAHKNWYSLHSRMKLESIFGRGSESVRYFELNVFQSTWMYLMLLQKTKRGCTGSYWYSDINTVLFREDGGMVEKVCFGGQNKNVYTEIVLPPGLYRIAVFSFAQTSHTDCTLKVYSAKPVAMREKEKGDVAALLHSAAILQEHSAKYCHLVKEKVTLLRIHTPSAIFFLACNASTTSHVNLSFKVQAENVKAEGCGVHELSSESQKILCVLHPKKIGTFDFSYWWDATINVPVNTPSHQSNGDSASLFQCIPLKMKMDNNVQESNKYITCGSGQGKAKFVSKTYGSAQ